MADRLPGTIPEAIVRTVRHEMGDFLQLVYATVAILKERLPPNLDWEQELLAQFHRRAETCRHLIDTLHDLHSPLTVNLEEVDLPSLLTYVADRLRPQYPELTIRVEGGLEQPTKVDRVRFLQIAQLLLRDACADAMHSVVCSVSQNTALDGVDVRIVDDGPGLPPQSIPLLFEVRTTAPAGRLGPALPLARRIVKLHGGSITADNRPEGGFQVEIVLPRHPGAGRDPAHPGAES